MKLEAMEIKPVCFCSACNCSPEVVKIRLWAEDIALHRTVWIVNLPELESRNK